MARYPDDGLDDEDYDRPLDEGGDLVERTEGRGPCDGVHDPGAGAHACSVCYPDADDEPDIDSTDVGRQDVYASGTLQRRLPRKAVRRLVEAWSSGGPQLARQRRTRTALNHLARRARRRAKRERRHFLFRSTPPGTALAGLYAVPLPPCARCKGTGIGPTAPGCDPDWCSVCGGAG